MSKQFEVKTDCFAYGQVTGRCKALIGTFCAIEDCKFYKTRKQHEEEEKKYGSINKV